MYNRQKLESRERGKWKHERWYAFGRSQNLAEMEQPKLMTPSIAKRAAFTLDAAGLLYFVGSGGGGGGGYGITVPEHEPLALPYLLGLLNSRLLDSFLQSYSSQFSGGYFAYNRQYIQQLPVRVIDFAETKDKARHDKIVSLVQRMLDLHKRVQAAKMDHERTTLERQIAATDAEIDRLVYELYGLSQEEIAIVEESAFTGGRREEQ